MNLYKVEFTFNDSYGIKVESFINISLTIKAHGPVTAQHEAWQRLLPLDIQSEPKSVTVTRLSATC